MSYPVNQPIPYAATPATPGYVTADHSVDWSFDDGATATGLTTNKTWTTPGVHTATAKATNLKTSGFGSASKAVEVKDWSQMTWTSTGQKIIPSASGSFSLLPTHHAHRLFVVGNIIVNVFDILTPSSVIKFDTSAMVRTEYSPAFGAVGSPDAAYLLDSGPNAGKIIIVGKLTGRYGFLDTTTGVFTVSPNSMPYVVEGASSYRSPMAKMGNGKLFLHGYKDGPSFRCMIYDQIADSWSAASGTGSAIGMNDLFTLPSGKLLGITDNSTASYIYNYLTDTWSSGPTLPISFASGANIYTQASDKSIWVITGGTTCVMARWVEGDASFTLKSSIYPYLSQSAVASNGNIRQNIVFTPDGFVVNIGGEVTSGFGINDTKTIFYGSIANDTWVVGPNFPTQGPTFRGAFCNGRLWRATAGGILEYSSVW